MASERYNARVEPTRRPIGGAIRALNLIITRLVKFETIPISDIREISQDMTQIKTFLADARFQVERVADFLGDNDEMKHEIKELSAKILPRFDAAIGAMKTAESNASKRVRPKDGFVQTTKIITEIREILENLQVLMSKVNAELKGGKSANKQNAGSRKRKRTHRKRTHRKRSHHK